MDEKPVDARNNTQRNLAYSYTAGYFILVLVVIFHGFPVEVKDILNSLLGLLSGIEVTIIQFFFGSSKSASDNGEVLKTIAVTNTTTEK